MDLRTLENELAALWHAQNDLLLGHQAAMRAYTVALARIVGKDRLAEELRLQVISFTGDYSPGSKSRDALLEEAWRSIARPLPLD
jgi:hypothetical protein